MDKWELARFEDGRVKVFIVAQPGDARMASGLGIEVDGTMTALTPAQWFALAEASQKGNLAVDRSQIIEQVLDAARHVLENKTNEQYVGLIIQDVREELYLRRTGNTPGAL